LDTINHITTRQASSILQCSESEALKLLKASGIKRVKIGSAYFWDAQAVDGLIEALSNNQNLGGLE